MSAGDAFVNEYFIRLTPDRQSKNGHLWSSSTLEDGEFVTTIKFRISGQVRNKPTVFTVGRESVW